METKECLRRIVEALSEQGYVFSKGVQLYYHNPDNLKQIEDKFVEPLSLSRFQGDMCAIAQYLPEVLLFPWRYIAPKPIFHSILGETQGLLSVVGIVLIPNLSQFDIESVLKHLDDVVLNELRKYPWRNESKATFGTLMCLFCHTEDAQRFNQEMRKYYCSHAFKNTFVSTISIDCEAETLTQGRAGIFSHKWHGGMEVSKLREYISCKEIKAGVFVDKVLDNIDERADEEEFVAAFKDALSENLMISEMEETINQIIPNAGFKYPKEYIEYDSTVPLHGWWFPKGKSYIQDVLDFLHKAHGVNDLIPFAENGWDGNEEVYEYACFLVDGVSDNKVVTVWPFGSTETFRQKEYKDISDWFDSEFGTEKQEEPKKEVKFLGMGLIKEAYGPVVAIPTERLKGKRLVMTTDAAEWYIDNDRIRDVVEKYGLGLKVLSVQKTDKNEFEVIMDVIKDGADRIVYVGGTEQIPPPDTYILATPFAGEFFVKLEAEDADGDRELLWADDFIYK